MVNVSFGLIPSGLTTDYCPLFTVTK